jgi:hypothetical protein
MHHDSPHGQGEEKRKRLAAIALGSLGDRFVLSASGAGSGLVAHDQVAAVRTSPARSTATIAREDDAFMKNIDRMVKVFTADSSRKLREATAMYRRLDPAFKAVNPAVKANFHDALTSIGPTLEGEVRAGSAAIQGTMASVEAGGEQAGSPGASAMSRAEEADQVQARASQSQRAVDRSAVAAFWSRYYGGFNAVATELAALPSPSPGSTSGHVVAAGKGTTSTGEAT